MSARPCYIRQRAACALHKLNNLNAIVLDSPRKALASRVVMNKLQELTAYIDLLCAPNLTENTPQENAAL